MQGGANTGLTTSNVMEFVQSLGYAPANGANYPNSGFTNGLKTIAQVAKANVGLEVAAITLGGWPVA